MSDGYTTRKLIRQEWKPLGGPSLVRYVAMPASSTVPSDEWTDDLQAKSYVESEVLGYAELPSGAWSPSATEFADFVRQLDEQADSVMWKPEVDVPEPADEPEPSDEAPEPRRLRVDTTSVVSLRPDATSIDWRGVDSLDAGDVDDIIEKERGQAVCDQCGETHDDGACWDEDDEDEEEDRRLITVADEAGLPDEVEYDSANEPYRLPREADPEALEKGVLYESEVTGIETYGIFVAVRDTDKGQGENVSGLIHKSDLPLQHPTDFDLGDFIAVEFEDADGGLSFVPHETDRDEGLDNLFNND